jgi:RNA polymerase sigma-70 factor (ECF subfamily)
MSTQAERVAVQRMDATAGTAERPAALLDERAFHALYARTAGPLRAYVTRTMGSATHADDIVQETFLRILRRPMPTLDDDALRAYTFRVASNLVIDHWRTRKREVAADLTEPGAQGPDQALTVDVARLFRRLKLRERQLVWLAHVEGADHREIAAALGLRTASIRVLLSRARRRFARLLRENGHAPEGGR